MHTGSDKIMQGVHSDSLLGILQYWLSDEVKTQHQEVPAGKVGSLRLDRAKCLSSSIAVACVRLSKRKLNITVFYFYTNQTYDICSASPT